MRRSASVKSPKRRAARAARNDTTATEVRIGVKIRHARHVQGLKLKDVAASLGCSESYLSKVENDVLRPSLSMLHRMAQVLNINIASLFADNLGNEQVKIIRANDRPVIRTHPLRANAGIELERLIADTTGALLECNIHRVEGGANSGGTIEHDGGGAGIRARGARRADRRRRPLRSAGRRLLLLQVEAAAPLPKSHEQAGADTLGLHAADVLTGQQDGNHAFGIGSNRTNSASCPTALCRVPRGISTPSDAPSTTSPSGNCTVS